MDFDQVFIFVYCIFACARLTFSEKCDKVDDCSCKTSKGTVDLHKLPKSFLSSTGGGYTFQYMPCGALPAACQGAIGNVAICQRALPPQNGSFDIGGTTNVAFSGDPDKDLQATYLGNNGRKSLVNITCDSGTTGALKYLIEEPEKTYKFELRTQYACLGSSGGNTPSSKKISTGSVLLIIFFVFLAIYFIAGILFLKFARGATGTELIPNYDFWTSLPGFIKDGVMFTCRGCKTESSYSQI